jgi:hypothetical protein
MTLPLRMREQYGRERLLLGQAGTVAVSLTRGRTSTRKTWGSRRLRAFLYPLAKASCWRTIAQARWTGSLDECSGSRGRTSGTSWAWSVSGPARR